MSGCCLAGGFSSSRARLMGGAGGPAAVQEATCLSPTHWILKGDGMPGSKAGLGGS